MPTQPVDFEALFLASDDPWHFRTRWYEARKRALTLACLPARRYASAYEPGCANGELSAELAARCDRLLVSDGSARAVALARTRLARLVHVEVTQAQLPEDWPKRAFDLVVISELGYFLTRPALDRLAQCIRASLSSNGTVLACHWRWPVDGGEMDGPQVHERLDSTLGMPKLSALQEADLLIEVWCRDGRSVAQREGFV